MALEDLKASIDALRSSPFTSINPQEAAGLETLKGLTDTSGLFAAAKKRFEDITSREILAKLTASGFGRSGAVGESLARGFADLALPIEQAGFQARNILGQAQLGVGQQIAARGQASLEAIVRAQALLEQLGLSKEAAARNAAQFAQELELRSRALGISSDQFAQTIAQNKEQFAKTFGLNEKQFNLEQSLASLNASRGGRSAASASSGASGLTSSPFDISADDLAARLSGFSSAKEKQLELARRGTIVSGEPTPPNRSTASTGGTTSIFGFGPTPPDLRASPFDNIADTVRRLGLRTTDIEQGFE